MVNNWNMGCVYKSKIIKKSIYDLYNYVKKENHIGFDPYDGLSGKMQRYYNIKYLNIILLQFNLYSFVNLRKILGIKKGCANKALAIFSRSYFLLYLITKEKEFLDNAIKLFDILKERNLLNNKDNYTCSSHYFTYLAPGHYLTPSVPDIICTTEFVKSSVLAYEVLGKSQYLEYAEKGINYLFYNLLTSKTGYGCYFKYTPYEETKIVLNASALALDAFSYFYKHSQNKKFLELGKKVARTLLHYQREDGAWPYSIYFKNNLQYWQVDFHQGYIIDGLIHFFDCVAESDLTSKMKTALGKGIDFYCQKQYRGNGTFYYRYPIKYPIDIHNQAQGIITFANLFDFTGDYKYLELAERVALYTIEKMQDDEGYFYTHKYPLFTNKIPYMRWGQAWMMLALTNLLMALKK